MSKNSLADRDAAVRKEGWLRAFVCPRHFGARAAVIFLLAVLLSGGCAGRRAGPVLEPYDVEKDVSAVPGGADGGKSAASASGGAGGSGSSAPGGAPGADGSESGPGSVSERESAEGGPGSVSERESAEGGRKAENGGDAAVNGRDPAGDAAGASDVSPHEAAVTVHVCGAVKKEGVYTLPEGSRIVDAVEAAGGFRRDADTSWLNLAEPLTEAAQIRVPTREEADGMRTGQNPGGSYGTGPVAGTGGPASSAGTGTASPNGSTSGIGSGSGSPRININTADKNALMQIPGIGESKAQRILDYREKNGRFETAEDIMKVAGIKEGSFQTMKEYITAE